MCHFSRHLLLAICLCLGLCCVVGMLLKARKQPEHQSANYANCDNSLFFYTYCQSVRVQTPTCVTKSTCSTT
eukprot:m.45083 g.45083  ORF g.45083 m.45083 type:complete len:72 (+) comp10863_c0_seq1:3514-3729(+)